MAMDSEDFDTETALEAVVALEKVLQRRTHRVKYLDQEYLAPGTLGEALRLPKITAQLEAPGLVRKESGLDAFQAIWDTLSKATRHAVLKEIGWYDPKSLDWEDHRSNRRGLYKN